FSTLAAGTAATSTTASTPTTCWSSSVANKPFLPALLLAVTANLAWADHITDPDGFTRPLEHLKFNPGLDQREFERASFDALNVYDPWERWNRRVYHFNYRFDEW